MAGDQEGALSSVAWCHTGLWRWLHHPKFDAETAPGHTSGDHETPGTPAFEDGCLELLCGQQ